MDKKAFIPRLVQLTLIFALSFASYAQACRRTRIVASQAYLNAAIKDLSEKSEYKDMEIKEIKSDSLEIVQVKVASKKLAYKITYTLESLPNCSVVIKSTQKKALP